MAHEYKVWDRVRVIGGSDMHLLKIGSVAEIISIEAGVLYLHGVTNEGGYVMMFADTKDVLPTDMTPRTPARF